MSVFNAVQRFRDSAKINKPYKKVPKSVREAFNICSVSDDGIFRIEENGAGGVFDRVYSFTDINYINRDDDEKTTVLSNLMKWLNFMSVSFKIVSANAYRNTEVFLKDLQNAPHADEYKDIKAGTDEWIAEKIRDGKISDIEKTMYLCVSVNAANADEAKSYILNLDVQLVRMFETMGSTLKPLKGADRLNVYKNYFYPEESLYSVDYDFKTKGKDPLSGVLPVSVEQEKDWLIMGGQCVSIMFAREYASSLDEGTVISSFTALPYVSFLTLDYAPVNRQVLNDMLEAAHMNNEKAIAQEEESRRARGHYATGISYRKEKQKMELERYQAQVDSNSESAFLVSMYCVVTADDEDSLAKRINSVKLMARENGIYMETCNFTQLKALNTALPNGCRLTKYPRAFLTSSLVALQPFFAQELTEEGGFFYGLNRTTKHLVFGNRKNLASPHGMIVGHTGSGKSFFNKNTEVAQTLLGTNDDLIVIDPQNEMTEICGSFGGQFIDMTPKSDIFINPLEITEDIINDDDNVKRSQFIADQTDWLASFCGAAIRNIILTEEHYSLLGRAVRNIYTDIFEKKNFTQQPTLFSVREQLKGFMETASSTSDKELARVLYNSLEEYTEGAFDLFAYPSNVDINKRFVVFGLANVPGQLWEPVMITIMHFLSNRMEYNKQFQRPTRLIVDETQVVCRNEASAAMLVHAVVTFRKFGGIVTMALQNLTRALENPDLRDMFSNCGYKLFLDQGGVDAESLSEVQELSSAEFDALSETRPGYGVLVWGKTVILLDASMSKDNPLYDTFTTNFHEKVQVTDENQNT